MQIMLNSMRAILLLLCIQITTGSLQAQQVGQQLLKELNSENKKLIIIYCWSSLCKGCIAALPKIDSLQEQFSEDVQFVLSGIQNKKEIEDLFILRKKIKRPRNVIYRFSDTTLQKIFPYETVPHVIWLTGEGKLLAITSNSETNADAIEKYLDDNTANLKPKKPQKNYHWNIPVLSSHFNTNLPDQYHSYILPAIDSFYQTAEWKKRPGSTSVSRIVINKINAIDLVVFAWNQGTMRFSKGYENVAIKLKGIASTDLLLYDLQVPEKDTASLYSYMKADIARVLGLTGRLEQADKKCISVQFRGDPTVLRSRGGETASVLPANPADSLWRFTNYPFKRFISLLEHYVKRAGYGLSDDTKINMNVDLSINADIRDKFDINQLNRDLGRYGLCVVEKTCPTQVLVIADR